MGDLRYVRCARMGLASIAWLIAGCSNANLGWNSFSANANLLIGPFPAMRVSGPTRVIATAACSGAFHVEFTDTSGHNLISKYNVPLQLTGTGAPTFYSDSSCTNAVTSVTLTEGTDHQNFYVKNGKIGNQSLSVANPVVPGASRTYSVNPGPVVGMTIRGPTTVPNGLCVPLDVTFQDAAGNSVPYDQTQNLSVTAAGATIYSDFQCNTASGSPAVFSLGPGQTDQLFYVLLPSITAAGTNVQVAATTPFAVSKTLVSSGGLATATGLAIEGLSPQIQIGFCTQMSAYPVDASGSFVVGAPAMTVNFTASHPGTQFFSDTSCTVSVTSAAAALGHTADIFMMDTTHEASVVTAASVGLTSASYQVQFINFVTSVAAGDSHSCAVLQDGSVRCWGSNVYGQLGIPGNVGTLAVSASQASAVNLPAAATQISAGKNHTCVIVDNSLATHQVWCWGSNDHGQLGPLGVVGTDSATPLLAVSRAVQIAAIASGDSFNCAVDSNQAFFCWGDNTEGQLGDPATVGANGPTPYVNTSAITPQWLSAAGSTVCAIDADGNDYCWGSNAYGQLMSDPTALASSMTPILISTTAHAEGLGRYQACDVDMSNFDVSCWGRNLYGELGVLFDLGTSTPIFTPQSLSLSDNTMYGPAVAGGDGYTCIVENSGNVICFGRNDEGQLGNGSLISSYEPTLISIHVASGAQPAFGAGKAHVCAGTTDGRVGCWGSNTNAQVGPAPGSTVYSMSPVWSTF